MKMSNRTQRIADQIQRDLADLIVREIRDPRIGLVTISGVEVSPDYAHARVFFTVIGPPAEAPAKAGLLAEAPAKAGSPASDAAEGLNAAAGRLHHLLFKRLRVHTVPRLHFVQDTSVERGFEIDRLIDEAVGRRGPD
ncbi:MAG TPA: 30S ribosome-binding factor RbfA [Burkholderiaceae bacterium]|jgi:ribosome-binding factor A|nr:30S ribosome-binding factor RbfA [Burkholderiaceae bacterium]